MNLTETRTDLFDALTTALTDPRVRVSKYPTKSGGGVRYDALVTIGLMGLSSELDGMVTCELDVQVGIGDIDAAFDKMDEILVEVDEALPIQWEKANWTIDIDQDDQVSIVAQADLLGHSSDDPPLGDLALINVAGDFAIINDAGDFAEIN